MVHFVEDEHVQIAKIAGNQIGHDVAFAVGRDFVTAGEPIQDQMNISRLIAFTD